MESENSSKIIHDGKEIDTSDDIVNKRRSAVFQRRSVASVHQDADNSDEHPEMRGTDQTSEITEDPFDLAEYIDSLKKEREMWKKKLQERKMRRRRLEKQASNITEKTELDLSILTESQRAFIQARPNYEHITKEILKLRDIAVRGAVLDAQVNDLYDGLAEKMDQNIVSLTEKIVKLVEMQKDY